MIAALLTKVKGKLAVGLSLSVIALSGMVAYQCQVIDKKGIELEATQAALKDTQTRYSAYQQSAQAALNSMAEQAREADARLANARSREKEIRNVPKDQDGGIPPVLSDSLKRMR